MTVFAIRQALDVQNDSKLHFNAILLLDSLFSNLLLGSSLKNDLDLSSRIQRKQSYDTEYSFLNQDFEDMEFKDDIKMSYNSSVYLTMRVREILKFWPYIFGLINSHWSNIRSLSYGIICQWVKSDMVFYI